MKKTVFLLILAVMLPQRIFAQDYDVYLCIGQSNMAGRGDMALGDNEVLKGVFLLDSLGHPVPAKAPLNIYSSIRKKAGMQGVNPAWSFSQKMHKATGRPILLVVNAKGGTGIDLWVKDAPCDTFRVKQGDDQRLDGKPAPQFYSEAVRRTRQALQFGQLMGILWHQGEADSGNEKRRDAYMEKLSSMVASLREDLGTPDVPFVAGETCHHGLGEDINPTLNQIAYYIPRSYCVSSDGLGMRPDMVHFTREAQIELGNRYAEAFLNKKYDTRQCYVKARNPFLHQWIMYPSRTLESIGLKDAAEDRVNKYGSWSKGPRFKATGFFHVQKYKDDWVMVDPLGRMHLEASVVNVRPGNGKTQKDWFNTRYGDLDNWRNEVPRELLDLGFNGSAAWSDPAIAARFNSNHDKQKFTYYIFLGLMSGYAKELNVARTLPGHTGYPGDCIVVFDPDFERYCDKKIRTAVSKLADDPCLIGYFSDNEMPLGKANLEGYLSLPETDYGRQEAERWLMAEGVERSEITDELREKFAGHVAQTYFSIVQRVLRRYDKNHMYLGCRFHQPVFEEKEVIKAAGMYCDIVSYNYYVNWELSDEHLRNWKDWSGKPFMVTEFYTKGMDSGLPNTRGAGWKVPSQHDRAVHYQNFCIKLLESDSCVGWNFFKYQDNDPTDKTVDPSNRDSNKGLFNNKYEPYEEFTGPVKEFNKRRYAVWRDFQKK